MDWSWFQTVNRWSADTPWAHGFFRAYANDSVVLFVAALALAGRAHSHRNADVIRVTLPMAALRIRHSL